MKSNNNVNTAKCNNDATELGVTCSNTDETMQPYTEDNMICNNNNDMVLSMDVTCNNTPDAKHNTIEDNLLCNINNDINLSIDATASSVENEQELTEPDVTNNTQAKYSVITSDISDCESDILSISSISHTSMSTSECDKVPLLVRVTKEIRDCIVNKECVILLPKLTTQTI